MVVVGILLQAIAHILEENGMRADVWTRSAKTVLESPLQFHVQRTYHEKTAVRVRDAH